MTFTETDHPRAGSGRFTKRTRTVDAVDLATVQPARFTSDDFRSAADDAARGMREVTISAAAAAGVHRGANDLTDRLAEGATYDDVVDEARRMFPRTIEGFADVDDLEPGYWAGVVGTVAHLGARKTGAPLQEALVKADSEVHRAIRWLPGE